MSSGEEFEVEEILEQRRRKGVLEYLVRWQGFNELYNSWEPVASLTHCKEAVKRFLAENKRSRSKSRSRSRGRPASQSRSKSRSTSRGRGRPPKSPATPAKSRSRSRSASRKTPKSAATASARTSRKTTSEVTVTKKEASPAKEEKKGRPARSGTPSKVAETKASPSRSDLVSQRSSTRVGGILERKSEVSTRSIETIRSTPVTKESEIMTTRSRMTVRQVENDEKPAPKKSSTNGEGETWVWWCADHAVLILFIIISIIALSFTIESFSGVRDKLVPDFSVLRQRLAESYEHSVEAVSHGFNSLVELLPTWGNAGSAGSAKTSPPPKTSAKSTGA
ncbi:chromo domain-containing protein cec-1-like [Littorina saxatilis]|uniref:Chromo domain-containing protein n=1 Tax=Littorina saxatilis TaxID=31220 RepID=A0AAN9GPF1_9CAEN